MGESGKVNFNYNFFLKTIHTICIVIIFICLVMCHFAPGPDSDRVEGVVWADEALKCGHLLNSEFTYPYAIPFGGNLFILPFVAIFGIGQTANSLGMLLFFCVFLIVCFMFINSVKDTEKNVAFEGIIIIFFSYCSERIGVDFSNHILHYQLGLLCILGILGALFMVIKRKGGLYYVAMAIFSIWSGANGLPTMLFACASVVSALILLIITEKYNGGKGDKSIICSCICIITGTIIGYIIYKVMMHNISESGYLQNMNSYNYRGIHEWSEKMYYIPVDWVELFMIRNPQGVSCLGVDGIRILISIFECFVISIIPLLYVYRYRKLDACEKIIFFTTGGVWGISLAQYIFFRGPEGRLLYAPCFMNFVLVAVWTIKREFLLKNKNSMIIVVVSLMAAFQVVSYVHGLQWKLDKNLINRIKETDIDYGFGDYWDANINNVNSKGQVKIRGVIFQEGLITPDIYNSEGHWYDNENLGEEFFIIINREEMEKAESYPGSVIDGMYKEMIECGDNKYILIFNSDVWDRGLRYVTD